MSPLRACLLVGLSAWLLSWGSVSAQQSDDDTVPRWNILFFFPDDWGRFAGHYAAIDGRPGPNDLLQTPNMDRIAVEGVVFRNAFVSAPSCTPSRSALFSGRHFFNTGRGAILRPAVWDQTIPAYPQRLIEVGYRIGKSLKGWRPGSPVDAPIGEPAYAQVRAAIAEQLLAELEAAGDPRVTGDGLTFERSPFIDVSETANRYADMMPEPGIAEE